MKYELTNIKNDLGLFQIKALKDFGDVKAGDLGGWVASEANLSQDGNAWIYDNAMAFDDAWVAGDAKVCDNAMVFDNACVVGESKIYGNIKVRGYTKIDMPPIRGGNKKLGLAHSR
jgi:hypothetical protein